MNRVRVDLGAVAATHYEVVIGRGVLGVVSEWTEPASSVVVITDDVVGPLWHPHLQKALTQDLAWIEIPSGEIHKTLETSQRVWEEFERHRVDRHAVVVNLGGGVVGDLGGFAAATFLRGIDFIQIPTTLLAQVDASVGGKVGVDLRQGKNRVGVFAQPRGVVIDLDTLSTLDPRVYRAGFAEVLKHGLIRDRDYLESLCESLAEKPTSPELESVVRRSVEIKADVVSRDPREAGLRKILNFGHTAGHAIESESLTGDRPLLHGEAVAIGMVIEARLSHRLGLLDREQLGTIERKIGAFGLPVTIPEELDLARATARIAHDKKARGGIVGWTLLASIGHAVFDRRVDADLVAEVMESSHG